MATAKIEDNKEIEAPVDPMTQMVPVYLPRAAKNEENFVFVGLNGKGYTIQRGVQVKVPRPVADILAESERMKDRQLRYEDEVRGR